MIKLSFLQFADLEPTNNDCEPVGCETADQNPQLGKSQKVAEVFSNSQPRLKTRKTSGNHKFLEIYNVGLRNKLYCS